MALTYSWNTITTGQTDADSPGDETLFDAFRENLIHNNEWIGKNYTPEEDHNHDGTNSKPFYPLIGYPAHFHEVQVTGVTWTFVVGWQSLRIPNKATTVHLNCRLKTDNALYQAEARLGASGPGDGTAQTTTSTTYVAKTLTLDVTGYGGQLLWILTELRSNNALGTSSLAGEITNFADGFVYFS